MEKKTKLTISGTAKKSFKNIEIAKTQGKNSVVIEKQSSKFSNRGGSSRPGSYKSKTTSTFSRGASAKPSFVPKSPSITSDFERRKLAEQRATKRLKEDTDSKDKKTLKSGTKKRELKLTVSRALSDEIEARERSLASVKRARQNENKNLTKEEAKENLKVQMENQTLASITYQNYFKLYKKLAGCTGTAVTESQEFYEIYNLNVVVIPTNKEMIRKDWNDQIFRTEKEKQNAIISKVKMLNSKGQPLLIFTSSVDKSEVYSNLFRKK